MRKVLVLVLGLGLGTSAIAIGDPGLPDIPAHRHFMEKDGRLVQVGPRLCDDPSLQRAFNQFHSNVHVAVPGTPGHEQAAPGAHNGRGSDITARGC